MGTVIQLAPREVLILLGVYAGLIVAFGRVLVSQFEKRMTQRFEAMETQRSSDKEAQAVLLSSLQQRQSATDASVADVRRTVDGLRTELPLQYVRREDWIRFGTTIDAKLDRLHDAVHQRNQREPS